ncbi:F-box protein [Ceratobasidium sp. AG-Ba]|nr:F-box protein [Ceratobasidium sp. AG-Ba]
MQIKLRGDRLVISHAIPTSDTPVFGTARGHVFALSWYNNTQNPLLIDSDTVMLEEYSVASTRWLFEGPSKIMHHKHTLRTFHISKYSDCSDSDSGFSEGETLSYDWPSHGSPSLFAAIRHSGISRDEKGYASAIGVPTLAFPRPPGPRPFIALRSPFEVSPNDSLIDTGTWLASYGRVHGCEFIYMRIRHITEDDLTLPWGEEDNLGRAFSPELRDLRQIFDLDSTPPSELSGNDLQVGGRIIEAIKITGS